MDTLKQAAGKNNTIIIKKWSNIITSNLLKILMSPFWFEPGKPNWFTKIVYPVNSLLFWKRFAINTGAQKAGVIPPHPPNPPSTMFIHIH